MKLCLIAAMILVVSKQLQVSKIRCPFGTHPDRKNQDFSCVFIKNGEKIAHGLYFKTSKNSSNLLVVGKYRYGERHGLWAAFYANGAIWNQATYNNGILDGRYTEWHPNGKISLETRYSNGRQNGSRRNYLSDGKLVSKMLFVNGVRGKQVFWNKKGEKAELDALNQSDAYHVVEYDSHNLKTIEGTINKGFMDGQFTNWHANGKKAIEGEFRQSLPVGNFKFWDAEGNREFEIKFSNYDSAKQPRLIWARQGKKLGGNLYAALENFDLKALSFCPANTKFETTKRKSGWVTSCNSQGRYDNGKAFYIDKNGLKEGQGSFLNGKQHGRWLTWYDNGQLNSETYFDKGRQLSFRQWNKSGHLLVEAQETQGSWIETYFYKNGSKQQETRWTTLRAQSIIWHPDGKVESKAVRSENDPKIRVIKFLPNGEKASDGYYDPDLDKAVGSWIFWPKDGGDPFKIDFDYMERLKHEKEEVPPTIS